MKDKIWHIRNDFLESKPRDILKGILNDDKANYAKAESELGEFIELLDDAMTLYLESLQGAYRHLDEWKSKASLQASVAMAVATLNYILLARHGILLGYYPEVRDLLRSCYERTTRCYLFFVDEKEAKRFLAGKQIRQPEVDKKLSKLESSNKREELLKSLREYYGVISDVIHPNLKSFEGRYGEPKLRERVGLEPVFGGLMSSTTGRIVIIRILQSVLSALRILGVILVEQSGKWEEDYKRISARHKELLAQFTNDNDTTS